MDELPRKRKMVQMAMRLYERQPLELPSKPLISVERNFFFSENNLTIEAKLDDAVYSENDLVNLSLAIMRPGGHGVKRLRVSAIQQVSVAMFSTGNFKNVVAAFNEDLRPMDSCHRASIALKLQSNESFSWMAMDETAKRDAEMKTMAPSVIHANKTMFIIRVHYYVQIVIMFGMWQRDISIKLPFLLKRSEGLPKVTLKT